MSLHRHSRAVYNQKDIHESAGVFSSPNSPSTQSGATPPPGLNNDIRENMAKCIFHCPNTSMLTHPRPELLLLMLLLSMAMVAIANPIPRHTPGIRSIPLSHRDQSQDIEIDTTGPIIVSASQENSDGGNLGVILGSTIAGICAIVAALIGIKCMLSARSE